MTVKRFVALLALVGALIVAGASPAFAHATLLTTEPIMTKWPSCRVRIPGSSALVSATGAKKSSSMMRR